MAKLNVLEKAVCAALCLSVILWQETSSISLGPYSATATQAPRASGGSEGCDQIICPPGKHCRLNEENGPHCVCNEICNLIYAPVCGSDKKTYSNDCLLQVAACKANTSITKLHSGSCIDDCSGFECPYYGYCELDANEQATCFCRLACQRIQDPVCGSDNKTYSNDCELEREACQTKTNITVRYRGECVSGGSSCENITCPSDKYCHLINEEHLPECVCNEICNKIYAPVCGSDGQTYSNECLLRVEACKTSRVITIVQQGSCNNSCNGDVTCPTGKSCQLNSEGQLKCVCSTVCTAIYDQVCGSDGKTYSSPCYASIAACETNTNITIVHKGNCNNNFSCDGVTCPTGKSCQKDSEGRPECVCNSACILVHDPVCGSDGKTYGNDCLLRVEACKTNTNITIVHKGSCNDSCIGVTCPTGKSCQLDSEGRSECVCSSVCTKIYDPVCGSNGQTYPNDCELEKDSCVTNFSITVLHRGSCSEATVTSSSIRSIAQVRRTPPYKPIRQTNKPKCWGSKNC